MSESNWKTWILLFVIGIGVSFELMKHTRFRQVESGETGDRQNSPYSVRVKGRSHPQADTEAAATRVAGHTNVTASDRALLEKLAAEAGKTDSATFKEGKGAEGKNAEEKCDEKNQKVDPKTGKKVACKKKKKKEVAKGEAEQSAPKLEETRKESDLETVVAEAVATGEIPQPLPNKPDAPFDSFDEWVRRLLSAPDVEETKRFIDHYQRHLVTDEVFFKIAEMMIEDSRAQMKQLGVLCVGLNPSLISFQLLAQVVKGERSGSAPRRDAESFLNRYTDLRLLSVLQRVLSSGGNSFTTVLAAQEVDTAASKHLKPTTSSRTGQTVNALAVKKNAGTFRKFLSVLESLTHSSDGNVKSQASSTLSNLQTLLGQADGLAAPATVTAATPGQGPSVGGVASSN